MTFLRTTLLSVLALAPLLTFGHTSTAASPAIAKECEAMLGSNEGLFTIDLKTAGFPAKGLTPVGMSRLKHAQLVLKHNSEAANEIFEGMETFVQMHMLIPSMNFNGISDGDPGAAKTALPMFLYGNANWPEQKQAWLKQMHEYIRPMELIGGQTEEAFKQGRSDLNITGSMLDNREIVILDEANNAPATIYSVLMSLLNYKERSISINVNGKQVVVKADKLRAVFMTGNATLYDMINKFLEQNMQSGLAFLNRFPVKMYFTNILTKGQEARRDLVIEKLARMECVINYGCKEDAELMQAEFTRLQAKPLDFRIIEAFAEMYFQASDDLQAAARDFVHESRGRLNAEVKKSEQDLMDNPEKTASAFVPAADWSERFRSDLIKVIKVSAAMDFLQTMEPGDLDKLKAPIKLGPLSLWRAFILATKIPNGLTRFDARKLQVEFGLIREYDGTYQAPDYKHLAEGARTRKTQKQIEDMQKEHRIFNEILLNILQTMKTGAKEVAKILNEDPERALLESSDFEATMWNRQRKLRK